jgi:hypothetical protein
MVLEKAKAWNYHEYVTLYYELGSDVFARIYELIKLRTIAKSIKPTFS